MLDRDCGRNGRGIEEMGDQSGAAISRGMPIADRETLRALALARPTLLSRRPRAPRLPPFPRSLLQSNEVERLLRALDQYEERLFANPTEPLDALFKTMRQAAYKRKHGKKLVRDRHETDMDTSSSGGEGRSLQGVERVRNVEASAWGTGTVECAEDWAPSGVGAREQLDAATWGVHGASLPQHLSHADGGWLPTAAQGAPMPDAHAHQAAPCAEAVPTRHLGSALESHASWPQHQLFRHGAPDQAAWGGGAWPVDGSERWINLPHSIAHAHSVPIQPSEPVAWCNDIGAEAAAWTAPGMPPPMPQQQQPMPQRQQPQTQGATSSDAPSPPHPPYAMHVIQSQRPQPLPELSSAALQQACMAETNPASWLQTSCSEAPAAWSPRTASAMQWPLPETWNANPQAHDAASCAWPGGAPAGACWAEDHAAAPWACPTTGAPPPWALCSGGQIPTPPVALQPTSFEETLTPPSLASPMFGASNEDASAKQAPGALADDHEIGDHENPSEGSKLGPAATPSTPFKSAPSTSSRRGCPELEGKVEKPNELAARHEMPSCSVARVCREDPSARAPSSLSEPNAEESVWMSTPVKLHEGRKRPSPSPEQPVTPASFVTRNVETHPASKRRLAF